MRTVLLLILLGVASAAFGQSAVIEEGGSIRWEFGSGVYVAKLEHQGGEDVALAPLTWFDERGRKVKEETAAVVRGLPVTISFDADAVGGRKVRAIGVESAKGRIKATLTKR